MLRCVLKVSHGNTSESSFLWLVPADRVLEVPLTDLSFEDREIILSEGELHIFDFSSLLEFNRLVCRLG